MHPTQKLVTPGPAEADARDATPAETLRVAADYIDTHGWQQGVFFVDSSELCPAACTAGAIRYAVYGYPNSTVIPWGPLTKYVEAALALLVEHLDLLAIPSDYSTWLEILQDCIAGWNDETGRTADEVAQALRAGADAYDLDVYAQHELDNDRIPTDDGFIAWQRAQAALNGADIDHTGGAV